MKCKCIFACCCIVLLGIVAQQLYSTCLSFTTPSTDFCVLCILAASLCQSDSPVFLWTGWDNGTLSLQSSCWLSLPDNALQSELQKSVEHADSKDLRGISAMLTAHLLSAPKDSFFPLVSLAVCLGLKTLSGQISSHYKWARAENNADDANK